MSDNQRAAANNTGPAGAAAGPAAGQGCGAQSFAGDAGGVGGAPGGGPAAGGPREAVGGAAGAGMQGGGMGGPGGAPGGAAHQHYWAGGPQMPPQATGAGCYGMPGGPADHQAQAAAYAAQAGMFQGPHGAPMPPPHWAYGGMPAGGMPHGYGQGPAPGQGPGMAGLVQEIANGGNGLSSLGKMLNFDDSEFWKGALVGAAAMLLLTNESVQSALFKTGVRAKDAVERGVDKVKAATGSAKEAADG